VIGAGERILSVTELEFDFEIWGICSPNSRRRAMLHIRIQTAGVNWQK
jgi:hypothetical protein